MEVFLVPVWGYASLLLRCCSLLFSPLGITLVCGLLCWCGVGYFPVWVVLIWLLAVDGGCSLYRVVLFCGVISFLCIGLCLIHPEGELVEVFMCSVFAVSLLPRVLVSLVVGFPTGVLSPV